MKNSDVLASSICCIIGFKKEKKKQLGFSETEIGINEELRNISAASLLHTHAHSNRNVSNQTKQSHYNLRILPFPQYSHSVHNYPVEFQY